MHAMQQTIHTVDDLLRMPDWREWELDRGRLVPVSKNTMLHGQLVCRIARHLEGFMEESDLGHVVSESGFWLERDPDTMRGPDVAFVSYERLPELPAKGVWEGWPDLAVEVVSPNNRTGETLKKIGQYLNAGTTLVWQVVPAQRKVAVHRADGSIEVVGEDGVLYGDPVLPGFALPVRDIFERCGSKSTLGR